MKVSEIMTTLTDLDPSLNTPKNYLALQKTGDNIGNVISDLKILKARGKLTQKSFNDLVTNIDVHKADESNHP